MDYKMYEYILAVVFFVIGLIMAVVPKLSTKKELRDNPNDVAKVRSSGVKMMICGGAILLLNMYFY